MQDWRFLQWASKERCFQKEMYASACYDGGFFTALIDNKKPRGAGWSFLVRFAARKKPVRNAAAAQDFFVPLFLYQACA